MFCFIFWVETHNPLVDCEFSLVDSYSQKERRGEEGRGRIGRDKRGRERGEKEGKRGEDYKSASYLVSVNFVS